MLIFDEKLMIFEAFLGPKYIKKTCFYMFFFVVFFDSKTASDEFAVLSMNGDSGPTRLSAKKRGFSFMMKPLNAKIQKNACIFIDFW